MTGWDDLRVDHGGGGCPWAVRHRRTRGTGTRSLYFLQTVLKMDFLTSNLCIAAALVLGTPFYVLFGRLSDKYGRQGIITLGLILSAVTYLPLYAWIRSAAADHSNGQVVVAVLLQIVFSAMVYGPMAAYMTELFPPRIRFTGLSVSYHLGTGVFGGFTPLLALSLTDSTGSQLGGVIYPIAMSALSAVVCLALLRKGTETKLVRSVWAQFATPERTDPREPAGAQ
ncbi:MFS transporter [Streptomyces sp. NPDC051286]|uniref:MFS transporter n=1 Tax=Streptomyces sp. NPDC051286 TaxID=3365647 RepID=UPI0037947BFA